MNLLNTCLTKNIKKYTVLLLIATAAFACSETPKTEEPVAIIYTNGQPTAIKFPADSLKDLKKDTLRVLFPYSSDHGLPGKFVREGKSMIFKPNAPLVPGQTYSVVQGDTLIAKITAAVSDK